MNSEPGPKNIALLGSTGSIGENSLDVVRQHPEHFRISYLTAYRNTEKLIAQAREFRPTGVVIADPALYDTVKEALRGICEVYAGQDGILTILQDPQVNLVLNALVGAAGLLPTYRAILAGKQVALANKESLVMAGQLISRAVRQLNVHLLPIDSEHSAIWQCLQGERRENIRRIILTASGGPFRTWTREKMKRVTVEQALAHPNWAMGPKITIDSATLMNKGLEVIEAYWLYQVRLEQIEVVIHPQSIIHSTVEFVDGSVKAQLGVPDMRIPIQYALTYPERLPLQVEYLSLARIRQLTFEPPDLKRFPALELAYQALRSGGTAPAVLNVANEVAVQRFLQKEIGFLDIPRVVEKTLQAHAVQNDYSIDNLLEIEKWTREFANRV